MFVRFSIILTLSGLLLFAGAACDSGPSIADLPPEALEADTTDLIDAIEYDDIDSLNEALEQGADPNEQGNAHMPPLHLAVTNGNLEAGRALLQYRADPNNVSERFGIDEKGKEVRRPGTTPLHTAIFHCQFEFVKLLVEAGADVNLRNHLELTPLDAALGRAETLSERERITTSPEELVRISQNSADLQLIIAYLMEQGGKKSEEFEPDNLGEIEGGLIDTIPDSLEELKQKLPTRPDQNGDPIVPPADLSTEEPRSDEQTSPEAFE